MPDNDKTEKSEQRSQENQGAIIVNVKSVILYSLSLAVALGFNEIMTTIFSSFGNNQHVIAKCVYVMTLFALSIMASYWLSNSFN